MRATCVYTGTLCASEKEKNRTMFPNKSGYIKSNQNYERLINIFKDEFKNGKTLKLENKITEGKFTIKKQSSLFNPFDRKIIMSEIKGQIVENEIQYEIRITNSMKFIFWIDSIALLIIGIYQITNKEYETGIMIISFLLIMILISYFWLNNELNYLENRFQEKMKYI